MKRVKMAKIGMDKAVISWFSQLFKLEFISKQ